MTEQLRENYFLAIRMVVLLALEIYIVLSQSVLTGASGNKVLLLLALLVGAVAGKELVNEKGKCFFLCMGVLLCGTLIAVIGIEFLTVGIFLCYEIISFINPPFFWYLVPCLLACVPSEIELYVQLIITMLLCIIYVQHDFIINSYKRQTKEDTISEQRLKRNMYEKEHELREEINRGLLMAENQLLEERARLSQTLHDKLGHSEKDFAGCFSDGYSDAGNGWD